MYKTHLFQNSAILSLRIQRKEFSFVRISRNKKSVEIKKSANFYS